MPSPFLKLLRPKAACALLLCLACHSEQTTSTTPSPTGKSLLVKNARMPGGSVVEVLAIDGVIVEVAPSIKKSASRTIDAEARYLVPGVIDSHVHLDFLPVGEEMAAKGIAAVVDLAAPEVRSSNAQGLLLLSTGPMLVAPGGYPTRSWGRDGYGLEVTTPKQMESTIEKLHAKGASLVKFSLGAGPDLSEEMLRVAIDKAHALEMKVAVHTLGDADAAHAAELGADILAHTPIEALEPSTIELWSQRAVVSTLSAFGNGVSTARNLRALQLAGATVLYGTDLGNTREIGISCSEIQAMQGAGMSDQEVLIAMTQAPAAYFSLLDLGKVEAGMRAHFLLVDEDPSEHVLTTCRPDIVVSDRDF